MQPHNHPDMEKAEDIHLIRGELVVIFFNDKGSILSTFTLRKDHLEKVSVPSFTWHTYIISSNRIAANP